MKGVELAQLRYFLAVAEELNFTRAAQTSGITQQSLSAAIARLESQLGVRLVERNTRRVALTPAGQTFGEYARRALSILSEGVDQARRTEMRPAAAVRIACVLDVQMALERRLNAFLEAYPDIALTVTLGSEPDVLADLAAGNSDLALLWNPGPAVQNLPQRTLTRERMVAVIPSDSWLAGSATIRPEDLGEEPLVLFERWLGPAVYDALVRQILHSTIAPQVFATPDMDGSQRSRADAVAAGYGVTVAAAVGAEFLRRPELAVRSLEPPVYLETTAIWRYPPPPKVATLIAFLCDPLEVG